MWCFTLHLKDCIKKVYHSQAQKQNISEESYQILVSTLKHCSLWKHMARIMMSSKITVNMVHGKEQDSHYLGSMTDMRWPLTLRKRLVPNESEAEWGVDGKGEDVKSEVSHAFMFNKDTAMNQGKEEHPAHEWSWSVKTPASTVGE